MRKIRPLEEADFDEAVMVVANAYPVIKLNDQDAKERLRQRLLARSRAPGVATYGLYENGRLLGFMRFHDYIMKLHSTRLPVAGLGGIAVDLVHKKEKVAKEMVDFFLHHYRQARVCLTALYPFRPDFYRQMGWGLGTQLYQYRIKPGQLPRGATKAEVAFVGQEAATAVWECYQRYQNQTNGLFTRALADIEEILNNMANRVVGCWAGDQIVGYIVFHFEPGQGGHFISNNMVINELVAETPAALRQLLTFLRSQADQIEALVLNLPDDAFYFVLDDPRLINGRLFPSVYHETSAQGVGLMYRVIDLPQLFHQLRDHNFGGQSGRLQLIIHDDYWPENGGSTIVHFANGRPLLGQSGYDVTLTLHIADFSSLIVGAISLADLYRLGLAQLSDAAYLFMLNQLFAGQKPICLTPF